MHCKCLRNVSEKFPSLSNDARPCEILTFMKLDGYPSEGVFQIYTKLQWVKGAVKWEEGHPFAWKKGNKPLSEVFHSIFKRHLFPADDMHFFLSRLQEENVAKQEDRFQASAELMITWSVSLFKLDDFTLPLKLSFNRFLLADLSLTCTRRF